MSVGGKLYHILSSKDVQGQLQYLRPHSATPQFRWINEMHKWWHQLIKPPHGCNLLDWSDEWIRFMNEARESGRCTLMAYTWDEYPILHWCWALFPIMEDWANTWLQRYTQESHITLEFLIEQLSIQLSTNEALAKHLDPSNTTKVAFASLGNQTTPQFLSWKAAGLSSACS